MEKEKPYQPTEEEMQKAEEMMTDEQKRHSEQRKNIIDGGPTGRREDENYSKGVYDGYYGEIKILEDGSIKYGRNKTWYTLTPEKALIKLQEALAHSEDNIKHAEKSLEICKTVKDKIGIMTDKVREIKEKQENS